MRSIKTSGLITIILFGFGCSENDSPSPVLNDSNTIFFSGNLSGNNQVPPNSSTAFGLASAEFNPSTKILKITATYSGISPILGHIHKGATGVNGPQVFNLGDFPFSSPIIFTSPVLSDSQEVDLMAHLYYVNLHTDTYGGGELRGQLVQK